MVNSFAEVTTNSGERPSAGNQDQKRHYSEEFSRLLAIWLSNEVKISIAGMNVLPPEGKVPTCFGSKSLDVGCLDSNGYLALDISIKTFNFKDSRTNAYSKNFTGRFYELLGEGLDLRLSYPNAVLAALIFLPKDGCEDGTSRRPSSFGNAVKQFQKIAMNGSKNDHALSFDFVFIGLHDSFDDVVFFDCSQPPPKHGRPTNGLVNTEGMMERLREKVLLNEAARKENDQNVNAKFQWE
eukprot:COSAG01_NODE_148_length_24037_cov_219.235859_5_plen_239_part_00